MAQLGRRLGFAFEPFPAVLVLTKMRRQELKRDFAIQLGILGQIHLTHSTGADLLDYPVVPDRGVFGQGYVRLCLVVFRFHALSRISQ